VKGGLVAVEGNYKIFTAMHDFKREDSERNGYKDYVLNQLFHQMADYMYREKEIIPIQLSTMASDFFRDTETIKIEMILIDKDYLKKLLQYEKEVNGRGFGSSGK